MLEGKMIERAKYLDSTMDSASQCTWKVPQIKWIDGVPGFDKTSWLVEVFNLERDMVVTSATETTNELRERLSTRIENLVQSKIHTMALSTKLSTPTTLYRSRNSV